MRASEKGEFQEKMKFQRGVLIGLFLVGVMVGFPGCRFFRPTIINYQDMGIDPISLKIKLRLSSPLLPEPRESYYRYFHLASGNYTVDHYDAIPQTGPRQRFNSFMVSPNDQLITRSKYQELLKGPFGTVYARATFYYAASYLDKATQFFTCSYMNQVEHEIPDVVETLPGSASDLSAISVVRIFRAPPGYLIVSANYAPDGHLESLHVNGAKNGDWVHSSQVPQNHDFEVGSMIGDRPQTRLYFGLPEVFPVAGYLRTPRSIFKKLSLTNETDAINLHYHLNRWVRQDSFLPTGKRSTRFLGYRETKEDTALAPIDTKRPFGQYSWTRKRSGAQEPPKILE